MKKVIFICFIIISACSEQTEKESVPVVELSNQSSNQGFYDYFENLQLVELDFEETGSWIGNVDIYKVTENHIYLLDESQSKKIVKFDLQGNFINELNSTGGSPGGFNQPSAFAVDEDKNEIAIIDRSQMKIYYFDLDFNLKDQFKLERYFTNLSYDKKSGDLLYFIDSIEKGKRGYVLIYQSQDQDLTEVLHAKYEMIPYVTEYYFFNDNSGFYHIPFVEKIYRLNPNSGQFEPLFQLAFENQEIPEKVLKSKDVSLLQEYYFGQDRKFASFNGAESNSHYFLFYHNDLENHSIAKIEKDDFTNNVHNSWNKLLNNTNIPVPFSYNESVYYSVGYLSKSDYTKVKDSFAIEGEISGFPKFKEKLFLFKFLLK